MANSKPWAGYLVTTTLGLVPICLSAQESTGDHIDEIIVTAQKRTQSINDVGMTIQATSGDELQVRGIDGPEDLAKLVAGFTYTKSLYSTPVFTLRGIGLYDATFGATPSVAVYTDQVPRNFPVMSSALDLDIERVEVLKGPQGTLFGQSSTGGAINYIVGKPTTTFSSGFDASYERFDRVEAGGYLSGPLSDTVQVRLALRSIQGGDWQYSESRPHDENGATRKLMGRFTIDAQPIDKLSLEASLTAVRDTSDVQAPQYAGTNLDIYSAAALAAADANPATRNPYGIVNNTLYAGLTTPGSANYDASLLGRQTTVTGRLNGTNAAMAAGAQALLGTVDPLGNPRAAEWTPGLLGQSDNSYYQLSLRGDYKLTDELTITSLTAYAHQKLNYAQDLDGTVAQGVDVPIFGDVRTVNQELRVAGDTQSVHWVVGASYDDSASTQTNYFELGDYTGNQPIPTMAPLSFTDNEFWSKSKTYSGFANVEFNITSALSVNGGIRYTHNQENATYCYNDPASDSGQGAAAIFTVFNDLFTGGVVPAIRAGQCFPLGDGKSGTTFGRSTLSPVDRSLDQNNVPARLGVDYKFADDMLAYASVSQGYKAGVFSAIGASSTSQYAPAVQEKVIAYETGVKMPFFDHRLQFNTAAFYYDYTNKQVRGRIQDPVYGLLEKMINVPKSHIWGLEGELQAKPVSGLTLSASATWLRSEVSKSFSETPDGSAVYNAQGYTGDFKGSQLPYTPTWTANADAEYAFSIGRPWQPFLGGNVLFQGRENTTFANSILLANEFEIPSYTTLDLRAGVRSSDGKWQLSAYGRNVLDRYYLTSITTYLDTRIRFTGMPATYGIAVKRKF